MRGSGISAAIQHNNSILPRLPDRYGIPPNTVSSSTNHIDHSGQEDNDNTQNVMAALSQSTDSSLLDW